MPRLESLPFRPLATAPHTEFPIKIPGREDTFLRKPKTITGHTASKDRKMAEQTKDAPGVIARPPRIYLAFLAAGFLIDYFLPYPMLPDVFQYSAGFGLIAAGLLLVFLSFRMFRRAETSIPTQKPATTIVSSGPFRFTRNPIYLGMSIIYTGIAIAADSIWVLALLAPILAVMRQGVILREERYLERKFGEDYRRYMASVRRWL